MTTSLLPYLFSSKNKLVKHWVKSDVHCGNTLLTLIMLLLRSIRLDGLFCSLSASVDDSAVLPDIAF